MGDWHPILAAVEGPTGVWRMIDPQGRIAKVYLGASAARNSQQIVDDLNRLRAI